ncbi:LysR family transcriptional regulator [Sphingosinithalassobacter tenebrarum]|uniref:LysR family transcriptional regulator n=2 Tax=Stakelama tenebrarum TaxID=2711215 RepID=A0A6G6YA87_9SPHN|nr:LysR family transcriptional regulator [Sphingosinithalassobacter tenebrarum]
MIELRKLRYLIAAAEAGSFSRAARNLNIKQSTLSRHILGIEQRLGMTLFDRRTRGATLTTNGRIYLRTAQLIVTEFEELNGWVRATQKGETGRLAVGFYTSFSAGNLRATVAEFSERFPGVTVRGFERNRDKLLAGIESGLLDIIIIIGERPYPGIESRSLWSERHLVVMPEGHPLASYESIYWQDLVGERFLLTERDPGPETRNLLLGKLGSPGYMPEIDMDDVGRDTVISSIALGDRLAIFAESSAGIQVPGVLFREIHEANGHSRIGYSGYWRDDNQNPILRRFLDFVATRYSLPSGSRPRTAQISGREPS